MDGHNTVFKYYFIYSVKTINCVGNIRNKVRKMHWHHIDANSCKRTPLTKNQDKLKWDR